MAGNDFCMVQLTAAGIALADGAPLTVNGRTSVVFAPGQPTRVARYEWDMMLKAYPTSDGKLLFELVPAAATTAPVATKSAAPAATAVAASSPTSKESN